VAQKARKSIAKSIMVNIALTLVRHTGACTMSPEPWTLHSQPPLFMSESTLYRAFQSRLHSPHPNSKMSTRLTAKVSFSQDSGGMAKCVAQKARKSIAKSIMVNIALTLVRHTFTAPWTLGGMNRTLLVGGFYQPRRKRELMLVRVSSGMKGFHQEYWSGFHQECWSGFHHE